MRAQWLDRTLYKSNVAYTLCISEKDFNRTQKDLGIPEHMWFSWISPTSDACVCTFEKCKELKQTVCIVCLGDTTGHNGTTIAALLVHEAMHVWQDMREAMGEHKPAVEQEAYAIQNISQSLFEEYVRLTTPLPGKKK